MSRPGLGIPRWRCAWQLLFVAGWRLGDSFTMRCSSTAARVWEHSTSLQNGTTLRAVPSPKPSAKPAAIPFAKPAAIPICAYLGVHFSDTASHLDLFCSIINSADSALICCCVLERSVLLLLPHVASQFPADHGTIGGASCGSSIFDNSMSSVLKGWTFQP